MADIVPPANDRDGTAGERSEDSAEDELAWVARQYSPPDDMPTQGESLAKFRSRFVLTPVLGIFTAVFGLTSIVGFARLTARGDQLVCFGGAYGCRPLSIALVFLGVFTLASGLMFLGLILRRE